MRYWVYINNQVIDKPFEEGELSLIPGFNANTLICKETPSIGETQEWLPAKFLIKAFRQPAPPPPPSPQTISRFANNDTFVSQEPKVTILSGNIFGKSTDNNEISISSQKPYKMAETTTLNLDKQETDNTEVAAAKSLEEEDPYLIEPTTEILSLEEVEEFSDDNQYSDDAVSEEEVLKTAIRTLITPKTTAQIKGGKALQAIDLANNQNIDLSENQDTYFEGATQPPEKKTEAEQKQTPAENTEKETAPAGQEEVTKEETPSQTQEEEPVQENVTTEQEPAQTPTQEPQDTAKESENLPEQAEKSLTQESKDTAKENIIAEKTLENIDEEEFEPEEEISIDDEDFMYESPSAEIKESSSPIVENVLEEFSKEKEEEKEEEEKEAEKIKEVFSISPVEIAELKEEEPNSEQTQEEVLPTLQDNILDNSENKEEPKEKDPVTLEELTGKIPQEQQETLIAKISSETSLQKETKTREGETSLQETPKEETAQKEVEQGDSSNQDSMDMEKDKFLTTFSSDIETVFLDQPTAFISDYIPPEQAKPNEGIEEEFPGQPSEGKSEILDIKSDKGQHQVSLKNVRRIKPAAIKTVPMVEAHGPLFNEQYKDLEVAQEAMAKVERNDNILNIIKTICLTFILLIMIIGFIALLAQFNILIPKGFSPLHAMLSSTKKVEVVQTKEQQPLSLEEVALKDIKDAEQLHINELINAVKEYKLAEGITLAEKIKLLHPDIYEQIEWAALQLPSDPTYYSITVSLPANPEGYALTYRFNYNTVTYSVEATTSEANNIMVKPYQEVAQ